MRRWRGVAVMTAVVLLAGPGRSADSKADPYGDISDLKLNKPEDKEDVKSVSAPKDAVVLFDSKSFDNWVGRNGKPVEWKLVDGGAMPVQPGKSDIVTKQKFDGSFKLHVEFRVPYMPKAKRRPDFARAAA